MDIENGCKKITTGKLRLFQINSKADASKLVLKKYVLVAKATLQSQMSICLSVQYQNPAASQNHAYWHNLSLPQPL